MELSHDLISQFAKLVTKDSKPTVDTTVYGTVIEDANGNKYVKLDGSDQLTPLSDDKRPSADSTTVKTDVGDRVAVSIKNHTATVTGNVSSPAAKNGDVENLGKQVSEVKKFDVVLAEQVQANAGYIKQLQTDKAEVGELKAAEAEIEDLKANKASIGQLEAAEAEIENLKTTKIDADVADLKYAEIKDLNATNAKINALDAEHGSFETLVTNKFTAQDADIANLQTNSLTAEKADIAYAKIDFSNMIGVKINEAAIEHLFASSGMVKDITIDNGVITGELIGVTLKGDLVEAGTLKADRLVVKGENGIYYKLNIEGGAVASAEVTKEQLQNGLSGSVIIAKSITAEKVRVSDLVAFGATIGGFQITDDSIHSVTKPTVSATTRGFYVDNDGQFNVGDSTNFVKFFKDTDGKYKLDISADSIKIGTEKKTIEQFVDDKLVDIEFGSRNLLLNSSLTKDSEEWDVVGNIFDIRKTAEGTNVLVIDDVSDTEHEASVSVASGSTVDVYGRNLWNNAEAYANSGVRITKTETGFDFVRGDATTGFYVSETIPMKAGVTYNFSVDNDGYLPNGALYIYADNVYGTILKSGGTHNLYTNTTMVYTADKDYPNAKFVYIINSNTRDVSVSNIIVYAGHFYDGVDNHHTKYVEYESYRKATYTADENGVAIISSPFSPVMTISASGSISCEYKPISGFVIHEDKECLNIKHLSFGETKSLSQSLLGKLEPNKDYTVSCSVLLKNVENGPTNPSFSYQLSGAYDNSGVETYWGRGSRNFDKLTDVVDTWQRAVWSFNTDDMPELLRLSLFLYTRDIVGDVYVRDLKLERGTIVTDWTPAPEDAENDLAAAVNDVRVEMSEREAYILEEADGITMTAINKYAEIAESQYYTKSEAATLKTEADNITASIKNVEQTIEDGEFTQVKIRETNFRMDIEGLTIEDPNSSAEHNISTTISNNGMVVKSNGVSKLTADASGVDAADLHASTYLIVGVNSRFEDYNNQTRTACFWIGN